LQEYLTALAEGRYDDAAVLLNEGGLEPERRADLRPLFTEYGDIDDLAGRLRSWCENETSCSPPMGPPVDIGQYWMAEWPTAQQSLVIGYFRSGSFEGSPSVRGLPPRQEPSGAVGLCPRSDVEAVREADINGDGLPDTIVVTGLDGGYVVNICNTAWGIPPTTVLATTVLGSNLAIGVLDPTADPSDTLLIGESGETGVCGSTYRLAASAQALVQVGWEGCWGANTGESIGCRDVDGVSTIVAYRYSFVGGDRLDNSTSIDVEVLSLDGASLDSFTLALPDQIEEAFQIVEPYCNGLPVMTEG
jgi:hypothetical protein